MATDIETWFQKLTDTCKTLTEGTKYELKFWSGTAEEVKENPKTLQVMVDLNRNNSDGKFLFHWFTIKIQYAPTKVTVRFSEAKGRGKPSPREWRECTNIIRALADIESR